MLPYTTADMLNKLRDDYGLDPANAGSDERTAGSPVSNRRERLRRTLTSLLLPVPLLYLLQPAMSKDNDVKESDHQHVAAPASPR